MRIHLYQQFFPGPSAPGSKQPRELVQALAARGHSVEVVCTDFNVYNEQDEVGEIIRPDQGDGEVHVHRIPSARGLRSSLRARLRTYVGFAVRAARFGSRLPRPDIVIGSVQPLFSGSAALRAARRSRAPFVLEVRDLWPDALEAKGAVTGWRARVLHREANRLYTAADRIVSLTPGIKRVLLGKGLGPGKLDVFPNGFDPELFKVPDGTRAEVRDELGWGDSFVALYAGAHTEVTAVETTVRAAADLRDRDDIRFDLFGQGQTKPGAIALAKSLSLSNVHFHDPVPKDQIPRLVAAADVGVMTLFKSPLIDIYFENKFMDFMGSGTPIVAAMDGLQGEIIQAHRTGWVVPSFDHEGLARAVLEASRDRDGCARRGVAGRNLVLNHLALTGILARYCTMIEGVAAGEAPAPWEPLAW